MDKLVFDYEGDILKEIYKNIQKKSIALTYLDKFIYRGKIRKVSRGGMQINKRLNEAGFDKSDHKFLELHMKLPDQTIIVSFDSDFRILKETLTRDQNLGKFLKNPKILTPQEANKDYFTE